MIYAKGQGHYYPNRKSWQIQMDCVLIEKDTGSSYHVFGTIEACPLGGVPGIILNPSFLSLYLILKSVKDHH